MAREKFDFEQVDLRESHDEPLTPTLSRGRGSRVSPATTGSSLTAQANSIHANPTRAHPFESYGAYSPSPASGRGPG